MKSSSSFMKKDFGMDELVRSVTPDGYLSTEEVQADPGKPRSPHVSFPELGKLVFNSSVRDQSDSGEKSRPPRTSSIEECVQPRKLPLFHSLRKLFVGTASNQVKVGNSSTSFIEPPSSKEFRRICSEIVPNQIYVSGWLIAEDWMELSTRGITHVINTASSVSKCPFPERVHYLPLSIEDSKSEDIQSYFYICIDFIESAISSGGRVLVHCMEGVSRSCSVVIAYLMWKRGLTYKESHALVQLARPICQPNTGFICQILDFQKVLSPDCSSVVSRTWRIQAKELVNGTVIIIPLVLSCPSQIDPRFIHVKKHDAAFEVYLPDLPFLNRAKEMVDMVCMQISRIEKFNNSQTTAVSELGLPHNVNPDLDDPYSLFFKFLSEIGSRDFCMFGQPAVTLSGNASDTQYTARSHRSHGSIDSAREDTHVVVYQIDLSTQSLDNPIPYFDSDDLDSRALYLFVVPDEDVVVWVGNEVEEIDDETVSGKIRGLIPAVGEIHIVQQGSETDAFWNLFEQG